MRILKYYDDIFEAHTVREFLVNEGIPAEVFNENTSFVLPITYANPTMRPYIGVADDFYQRAAELIGEEASSLLKCPDCGSTDIGLRLSGKYRGITRFLVLPLMLLGINGGNIRKVNSCNNCGREFRA